MSDKITLDLLKTKSFPEIQELRKHPATRAQIDEILRSREAAKWISQLIMDHQNGVTRTPETAPVVETPIGSVVPSTEELAAQAEAQAEAQRQAEAAAVAAKPAYEVDDAALKAVGITVTRDAKGVAIRYVQDYHVRDEEGNPIGRPTHLEARSLPELIAKQQDAHVNATRAFNRLKKQKLTFKPEPKPVLLSEEEIIAAAKASIEEKDPVRAAERVRQIVEQRATQRAEELQQREQKVQEDEYRMKGVQLRQQFILNHLYDFNPCEANLKLLGAYILENNLDFTLDNLEVAFLALQDEEPCRLAEVSKSAETSATAAANPVVEASVTPAATPPPIPAVATPVTETRTEVPAQPVASVTPPVEAPTTPPVTAPNVQTVTRRPGVNGSLPPGSLSAQRPEVATTTLTLQDIAKMPPEKLRQLKKDPKFVAQLEALGIIDLASKNRARGYAQST